MTPVFDRICGAVIAGDDRGVGALVDVALTEGIAPYRIIREAVAPAMEEVGRLMEEGEYYLPEVLLSARCANMVSDKIKPLLAGEERDPVGSVLLGTVHGDVHDIGKNLVKMMLEGVGFDVTDIGVNVPERVFVEKVRELRPDIVGMSALLSNTIDRIPEIMGSLKAAGLREGVVVLVGGAAVSEEYARMVGADGYASDAGGAARVAQSFMHKLAAD